MFLTRALLILALTVASAAAQNGSPAPCAPEGVAHIRTTLYFGLARPTGAITERQWKAFIREEVTPRFPQGFTVWEAAGQWRDAGGRIEKERAKVLLVVHQNTGEVRDKLAALVSSYKRLFQQESVLWETATVCAAF